LPPIIGLCVPLFLRRKYMPLSVTVKWLAVKTASEMTYAVSGGALNSILNPICRCRCFTTVRLQVFWLHYYYYYYYYYYYCCSCHDRDSFMFCNKRGYATVCRPSVRPSVSLSDCPSVCEVQVCFSHRLECFENNFTAISLRFLQRPQHGRSSQTGTLPKLGWNKDGPVGSWAQKPAMSLKRCKIGPRRTLDWYQNQWPRITLNGRNAFVAEKNVWRTQTTRKIWMKIDPYYQGRM